MSMAAFYGSSPRAWGKDFLTFLRPRSQRIIPTGVGKSFHQEAGRFLFPDHPHGRGEKGAMFKVDNFHIGSSPRAWGKGGGRGRAGADARIIPTGVGKSYSLTYPPKSKSDHPHGRGEKRFSIRKLDFVSGSSPRAWGKDFQSHKDTVIERIIPTGVGKSKSESGRDWKRPDHPHGRGEKSAEGGVLLPLPGSSPRAWGKGAL